MRVHEIHTFTQHEQRQIVNNKDEVRQTESEEGRNGILQALDTLHQTTGIRAVDVTWRETRDARHPEHGWMLWPNRRTRIALMWVDDVRRATLGPLLARYRQLPIHALLVAPYINPVLARLLREARVQFVDMAGNAFVERDRPFIRVVIEGRKPVVVERPARRQRALRATGLRVIFPLLCLPHEVNAPYRTIAEHAGVALGAVANTLAELRQLGYLRDTQAGREILQRDRLIDAWVAAFAGELRPTLNPVRYRVREDAWWRDVDLAEYGMKLGGEAAAERLTGHLRATVATIFGTANFKAFARRYHAARDEEGGLVAMNRFWNFEMAAPLELLQLAPPLLVYAELIATADARNIETAALIREKYLA